MRTLFITLLLLASCGKLPRYECKVVRHRVGTKVQVELVCGPY